MIVRSSAKRKKMTEEGKVGEAVAGATDDSKARNASPEEYLAEEIRKRFPSEEAEWRIEGLRFAMEVIQEKGADAFLRMIEGRPAPTRNDCGYERRYDYEDASRMHGFGVEGKGMCDYPDYCPIYQEGRCPLKKDE